MNSSSQSTKSGVLSLYFISEIVVLALMSACILVQSSLTLGEGQGKGYLFAYLYPVVVLLAVIPFRYAASGLRAPQYALCPTDQVFNLILGIVLLGVSLFFSVTTSMLLLDMDAFYTRQIQAGTAMLHAITGVLSTVFGIISGIMLIAGSRKPANPRPAMLMTSVFMLVHLIDQTSVILPHPDIAVYGPLIVAISLSALFFLETAKYKGAEDKVFRRSLVLGCLSAASCFSAVILWAVYTGKFLGRLELYTLLLMIIMGLYMLFTCARMIGLSKKLG